MTFRKISFLLSFLLFASYLQAQQSATYTSDLVDYQKALTLYNNKQYQASQSLFEAIKNDDPDETVESDCAYYIANCAVRLNQQNADDLIQDFVDNYPTSTKRNTAFLDVADYYFKTGKYAYAAKWYAKVTTTNLTLKKEEEYNFRYAYSLFVNNNYSKAKPLLLNLLN